MIAENDNLKTAEEKMQEVGTSTTWLEMKRNYTTWGQVKLTKESPHKSKSTPDISKVRGATFEIFGDVAICINYYQAFSPEQAHKKEASSTPDNTEQHELEMQKRYSLTLWEQYKRAHSMSWSSSLSELKTPDAFTQPTRHDQMLKDASIQRGMLKILPYLKVTTAMNTANNAFSALFNLFLSTNSL